MGASAPEGHRTHENTMKNLLEFSFVCAGDQLGRQSRAVAKIEGRNRKAVFSIPLPKWRSSRVPIKMESGCLVGWKLYPCAYCSRRQGHARLRNARAPVHAGVCPLGIVAVILVAALAHWSRWLLPVSVLITSSSWSPRLCCAVLAGRHRLSLRGCAGCQAMFSAGQHQLNLAADPPTQLPRLCLCWWRSR